MTKITANIPGRAANSPKIVKTRSLAPPLWAQTLAGKTSTRSAALSRVDGEHFTLITTRIDGACGSIRVELEEQSFAAYESIAIELAKSTQKHAVRFWNHVPAINEPADAGRDYYMVFNAGRFRAFSDWYGSPAKFDRDVATASAIGHTGDDLVVHCLAADAIGAAVNNPRQVAPYHYSQRFGPLPPCFARATKLTNPKGMLLVGGTASVRGEDSVHLDDLPAQLSETLTNLAALIAAAVGKTLSAQPNLPRWLGAFRELRVYYPNANDAVTIESAIRKAFPSLVHLEMLEAHLCRAELLVEIEGLADLNLLSGS